MYNPESNINLRFIRFGGIRWLLAAIIVSVQVHIY